MEGLKETEKLMNEASKNAIVEVIQVDLLVESDMENAVQRTVETFGRLDYAVNAAGSYPLFRFLNLSGGSCAD